MSLCWNHRLTIEAPVPGNQVAGEPPVQWALVRKDVAAEVVPLAGREYYQAKQIESDVSHRIRTPFFTGASSKMRLVRMDVETGQPERIFHVESVVNELEQNRWLIWMCKEAA